MKRTRHALSAAALLLAAGAALAQTDAPALPERPDIDDADRIVEGMQNTPLILLSSGDPADRSVLTLLTDEPASRAIEIRSTLALLANRDARELVEAKVPAAVYTVRLEAQPASRSNEDADAAIDAMATTFTITEADVDDTPPEGEEPYEPEMLQRARVGVQSTADAILSTTRSADGAVLDTTLVRGNAGLLQNTNTITYWATLELRLPATPVAPGARWRTLTNPDTQLPLHIDVITDWTLIDADEDTFTVEIDQRFLGRPVDEDDLTNPYRAIISATAGTMTIDRRLGVPVEGDLITGTWLTISQIRGGVAQTLNQGASATTTITPVDE